MQIRENNKGLRFRHVRIVHIIGTNKPPPGLSKTRRSRIIRQPMLNHLDSCRMSGGLSRQSVSWAASLSLQSSGNTGTVATSCLPLCYLGVCVRNCMQHAQLAPRKSPDPKRGPKIHLFRFGDDVWALLSQQDLRTRWCIVFAGFHTPIMLHALLCLRQTLRMWEICALLEGFGGSHSCPPWSNTSRIGPRKGNRKSGPKMSKAAP